MCLIASMLLAGCLGPSSASWGSGSGAVSVDFSMESTTVKTTLTGEDRSISDLVPVGCTPGSDGGTLDAGTGEAITFTGYLASSQFYDTHDPATGPKGLELGVTTAVAIQSMSFDQAASVVDGEGARIDVKQWSSPLRPETGAGSVKLEKIDSDSDTEWFVLGLIPTTEDILSGMKALGEWHQPVVIHGYLVSAENSSDMQHGYYNEGWHKANDDCSMTIDSTNRQDTLVFVNRITLQDATVSANGEDDNEWVHGDVPFLGRGGFILFFLAGGIGGCVGLFIVSKQLILKSAKQSMRILIGEEGMKKAASVKTDAKAAKAAGMESPTQRQHRNERERKAKSKAEPKASSPPKKTPRKEKPEDALGGFDLDSVLASTSTGRPNAAAPSGRKSSVVATESAQKMDRMNVQESTSASLPTSVGQQRQSSAPSQDSTPAAQERAKPTVRRRKAVKKAKPPEGTPRATPEPETAHYEEEEDFSDFSF